jgi:flagellar hook-length control protein FliK
MIPLISASSPSQNATLTTEDAPQLANNPVPAIPDASGAAAIGAKPAKTSAASASQAKPAFAAVLRDRLKATVINKAARDATQPTAAKSALPTADNIDSIRGDTKEDDDTSTDNLLAMLTQDLSQKSLAPSSDSESVISGSPLNLAVLPQKNAEPTQGDAASPSPVTLLALPTTQAMQSIRSSISATPSTAEQGKSPIKDEIGPASNPQPLLPSQVTVTDAKPTAAEAKSTAIIAATTDAADKMLPEKTVTPSTDNVSFPDLLRATQSHAGAIAAQPIQPHLAASELIARAVQTPINSARWADDVGNHLTWMVGQSESKADLVLNPPQLGRIEVSISITGDQATASFVSANAEVRDALQGSLPRLREILADTGVFLGQTNIGAGSSQQGGSNSEKGRKSGDDSFSSQNRTLVGSLNAPSSSPWVGGGKGLVDLFA